ncbi:MAG: TMEM175 family protein [Pseudomonadaceae bacterium]|nr:TMEM175 family protein [Pseudomonadaceae bacterium]
MTSVSAGPNTLSDESTRRLETFVDAAFAFAVTMLVISIDEIPGSLSELLDALKGVPAFAVSFAQIMLFWIGHRRWSEVTDTNSTASTLWTLALVFVVMIYIYPLKLMFGQFFHWASSGYFPSAWGAQPSASDLSALFAIFGFGMSAMALCLCMLYHCSAREAASSSDFRDIVRAGRAAWAIVAGVALLAAICSLALPFPVNLMSPWLYLILAATGWLARWLTVGKRAGERA